jgi:hypothetical protein
VAATPPTVRRVRQPSAIGEYAQIEYSCSANTEVPGSPGHNHPGTSLSRRVAALPHDATPRCGCRCHVTPPGRAVLRRWTEDTSWLVTSTLQDASSRRRSRLTACSAGRTVRSVISRLQRDPYQPRVASPAIHSRLSGLLADRFAPRLRRHPSGRAGVAAALLGAICFVVGIPRAGMAIPGRPAALVEPAQATRPRDLSRSSGAWPAPHLPCPESESKARED